MFKQVMIILCVLFFISCKNEKKPIDTDVVEAQPEIIINEVSDVNLYSGKLMRVESFPSKYVQPRHVDIWLPEDYSENKKYAVLYMHDGQMLFDSTTTWNKQEWKVDEWASKLMREDRTRDFIVVAPWNISEIRHADYYPQKPFELLPRKIQDSIFIESEMNNTNFKFINSDNYLKFLVKDLKPYIDHNFHVLKDKQNTFVVGSSMGGLISMYAISEYPETFGGAACISTHWPGRLDSKYADLLPEKFFLYMQNNLPSPESHKLYFDYGNMTLDEHYPQYAPLVDQVLTERGYTNENSVNLFFEGTDHSENSWSQRLDIPLTFLLGK